MPLSIAGAGYRGLVQRLTGREDTRRFLAGLGFVLGAQVEVLSENGGNLIVRVRESRVALSRDLALHIHM